MALPDGRLMLAGGCDNSEVHASVEVLAAGGSG